MFIRKYYLVKLHYETHYIRNSICQFLLTTAVTMFLGIAVTAALFGFGMYLSSNTETYVESVVRLLFGLFFRNDFRIYGNRVLILITVSYTDLTSMTTGYPHTVTRVGDDVTMTMNPTNVTSLYYVWVNGSVAVKLLMVHPEAHRVVVLNSSHTGYMTRIGYTGEGSPSQTGQLRFTIYNVTVQDAGTYYCKRIKGHEVTGCRQVLVVAREY